MRVVVTASKGRLDGVETLLAERGYEVLRAPLTEIESIHDPSAADRLRDLPWWLFPSRSAVLAALAQGVQPSPAVRIAAVGPGTATELRAAGWRVDLVAPLATAEGLVEALLRHDAAPQAGHSVGAVQGDRARSALREALAAHGVRLESVVLYRSRSREWSFTERVDAVVLASPSALAALPAGVAARSRLIAIGPTTARAVRRRGLPVTEALEPTALGVADAVQRACSEGAL